MDIVLCRTKLEAKISARTKGRGAEGMRSVAKEEE